MMAACLGSAPAPGSLLVVDDEAGPVEAAAAVAGARLVRWRRRAGTEGVTPSAWPPDTSVAAATVRLPKGREALSMTLHASLARVRPGGTLWLYGANDEGIRSAGRALGELCQDVVTQDTRRHCRVWRGRRGSAPLRERLDDWCTRFTVQLPNGPVEVASFPGLFSHGRLDPATRLLAETLPDPGLRALDFGCGAGVLSLALRQRAPQTELHLLDRDALAVEAARRNLPGAVLHLGDSWRTLPADLRFDLVMSNPPIHRGFARDDAVVRGLIEGAAQRLTSGGMLLLVAQRSVPLPRWLEPRFARVALVREDRSFRVWRARSPRPG